MLFIVVTFELRRCAFDVCASYVFIFCFTSIFIASIFAVVVAVTAFSRCVTLKCVFGVVLVARQQFTVTLCTMFFVSTIVTFTMPVTLFVLCITMNIRVATFYYSFMFTY